MPPAENTKNRHLTAFRRLAGPVVAACKYPGLRRGSRRSFCEADKPSVPAPRLQVFDGVQLPSSGTGPGLHRRYHVDVFGADMSPSELIAAFVEDPNCFSPTEYATFGYLDDPDSPVRLEVGRDALVRISGPYDAPVRVVEIADDAVRLQTREGHIEAGQIRFSASMHGAALRFEINSWARSAGIDIHVLWWTGLAYELQTIMWTHVCRRAAEISGGTPRLIQVETENLSGEDCGLLGEVGAPHLDEQAS